MSVLKKHLESLFKSKPEKDWKMAIHSVGKGTFDLCESDQNQEMKVSLTKIDKSAIIIKCRGNLGAFIKDEYGEICDYFIIVPSPKAEVFFIELKKTQMGRIGAGILQIKCSIPLLHFILSALKEHCNYELPNPPKEHYVILSEQKTNKPHKKGTYRNIGKNPYSDPEYPQVLAYVAESLSLKRIRAESDNAKKRAKAASLIKQRPPHRRQH